MIYGYENFNSAVPQISELVDSGKYTDYKIDRLFTQEKFKRRDDGRIIPPRREEDEEYIMYNLLKKGDIVITSSLINLSASTDGILKAIKMFLHKGVRIISVLECFDSDLLDRRTFEMIAVVSEKAQRLRHELQKKGIAAAREAGRYGKQVTVSDFPHFEELYLAYQQHALTKTEIAKQLQISRPTLDKLFTQQQLKQKLTTYFKNITDISQSEEQKEGNP